MQAPPLLAPFLLAARYSLWYFESFILNGRSSYLLNLRAFHILKHPLNRISILRACCAVCVCACACVCFSSPARAKRANCNEQRRNSKKTLSRNVPRDFAKSVGRAVVKNTSGVKHRGWFLAKCHTAPFALALLQFRKPADNNFTLSVFPRLLFTVVAGLTATL